MIRTSKSNLPLVSIVIPIFNVEKYISQCLNSAISQTYKNIEILCIDDNGEDESMKIVSSLSETDSRIKIIHHKTNLGLGPARNTGIRESRGDYIYFLDADDWIKPNEIENLVIAATQNSADIVIGSAYAFPDTRSENLEKVTKIINKWLLLRDIPSYVSKDLFYKAISQIPCVAWGKLFDAKFLNKNFLTFINKKILHEDNGFHVKCMACKPRLAISNNQGYQYRIRSKSLMSFETKDKSKQDKEAHVKISIEDAISFLHKYKFDAMYTQMTQDAYWYCFSRRFYLLKYYFGNYYKILRIGKLSIFKQFYKKGKIHLKILGITCWKWNPKFRQAG